MVPVRQRLVWKSLLAALPSVTGPQGRARVLDCGGGSGRIAVPLAGVGAIVTVVDTSADALATLRRRAEEAGVADDVHPVQGDVEGLANLVTPASFDLVLAHGILEAVDGIEPVFAAMAGAVRPGGLLSVLTVNPAATVLSRALAGDLAGESQHGVGVFAELVPGAALDAPGATDSLAELEATVAGRAPFADIAGRIHTLARRPD
jgi:2-polyprenyl-3-methyl-5-hydroxy-6-metoxy-1,4-benzoquinol methylase